MIDTRAVFRAVLVVGRIVEIEKAVLTVSVEVVKSRRGVEVDEKILGELCSVVVEKDHNKLTRLCRGAYSDLLR